MIAYNRTGPTPPVKRIFEWWMARVRQMLRAGERRRARLLAQANVESLRTLVTRPDVKLDLVAFAQVLEVHLGTQARSVKKYLVAAVVGNDKAKTLVFDYLLDSAKH
jgi:hypothetical protein